MSPKRVFGAKSPRKIIPERWQRPRGGILVSYDIRISVGGFQVVGVVSCAVSHEHVVVHIHAEGVHLRDEHVQPKVPKFSAVGRESRLRLHAFQMKVSLVWYR